MRGLSFNSPRCLIGLGLGGIMRTRTKWMVAGGAAAFVLAPAAALYGPTASTVLDTDLQHRGVVIDVRVANDARVTPAPSAPAKATEPAEPAGKKTVSAATPTSPQSPAESKPAKAKSSKSSSPKANQQNRAWTDDSPASAASPD